ncbi:hypothetical protein [Simiduia agarivorans]|uniref:hypothetical protein n=1 Tax=Simiduia agarivorans TaxID=447471 RepID=UPI00031E4DB5|nr:hypothetical protein [Simiduia agarivorans]
MNITMQSGQSDYAFVSPYTVEYVQGGYVIYCLMKPVSSHASFAEADKAMRSLTAH